MEWKRMRVSASPLSFVSAIILLASFFISNGNALSCSKVVTTRSHGLLDYLAQVSFPAPIAYKGTWRLEMFTDIPFTFIGVC